MRVGIDARVLGAPILKGIAIYLQNLLASLLQVDSANEYVLYTDDKHPLDGKVLRHPHLRMRSLAIPYSERFFFWEQLRLPLELATHGIDVLHSPANTTSLVKARPTVVTVHDTKLLELDYRSRAERYYHLKVQPAAVRSARKVICPSEFSRECVHQQMGVPESSIAVIHQGIGAEFRPVDDLAYLRSVQNKYRITEPYLLFSGGESPAKNISRLIAAFALLSPAERSDLRLVIPGIRTRAIRDQHTAEIQQHSLGESVRLLEYVPTEDLVALYNRALVFIYPSLWEGFGFPPLEAMACGAPVVASNATSIPEVVGDAGILFDATNVGEMADAIRSVVNDQQLQRDLRARGLQRAKQFSWAEAAKQTLEVYAQACA